MHTERFHVKVNKFLNFRTKYEALEDGVEGNFTFYFLSMIIFKNSLQFWIVKDGVSCISCLQAGVGIFQCYYIVPSLEKIENLTVILPRNFPAVVIIFAGQGTPAPLAHTPQWWGGASIPDLQSPLSFLWFGMASRGLF